MEKVIQKFESFEEAQASDDRYYASLTPQQRMDILLRLIEQGAPADETQPGLERVYRVTQLEES